MSDRLMIGGLATAILIIALLHFAQSIFVPLAFALFVIALVWPLQAALQQRMPKCDHESARPGAPLNLDPR